MSAGRPIARRPPSRAALAAALALGACSRTMLVGEESPPADGGADMLPPADGPPGPGRPPFPCSVRRLAAGGVHTCALGVEGAIFCWGGDLEGQLGQGERPPPGGPPLVRVMPPPASPVIATGGAHTCALDLDGTVWCWGRNVEGQLGDGSHVSRGRPMPVDAPAGGFVDLAAGEAHTCALRRDGTLFCFGLNEGGQIGIGDPSPPSVERPVPVMTRPEVVGIAAGGAQTCARMRDGSLLCWGAGPGGSRRLPAPVDGLGPNVADVAVGASHTCAITGDRDLFCWGSNGAGEIGIGRPGDPVPMPVHVDIPGRVRGVAAGNGTTCAVNMASMLFCWGRNEAGQLGVGDRMPRPAPSPVLEGIRAIDLGGAHACSIHEKGIVACWGRGMEGQLGAPGESPSPRPAFPCP